MANWPQLDLDSFDYHPVTVAGRYEPEKTVLVFTSLSDAKGRYDGPGYWVMTPVAADGGGTVFVNRGFIPQKNASAFATGGPVPQGETTITGIGVAPEEPGPFTPGPDKANHVEYVRDPARLAAMADVQGPVLGITIDAPASRAGGAAAGRRDDHRFSQQPFRLCADLVRVCGDHADPAAGLDLAAAASQASGKALICLPLRARFTKFRQL